MDVTEMAIMQASAAMTSWAPRITHTTSVSDGCTGAMNNGGEQDWFVVGF